MTKLMTKLSPADIAALKRNQSFQGFWPQALIAHAEALEAAREWEQDHLWAFLRSVLLQGQDIARDYREKGYELMSARVDEAAREREDELNKHREPKAPQADGG